MQTFTLSPFSFRVLKGNKLKLTKCEEETSGHIIIPEKVLHKETEYTITIIGSEAFEGCNISSITIPNSITKIETLAFNNCNALSSISIPDSITKIEANTFVDCTSLSSITFPNTLKSIGCGAFNNCISLSSITIPASVKIIEEGAFYNCKNLKEVTCLGFFPPKFKFIWYIGEVNVAFSGINKNAVLNVPALEGYSRSQWTWYFKNIQFKKVANYR